MYLDYGQSQPDDKIREVTARSWTEHLRGAGVDWSQVHMIYGDAVKAKAVDGNTFMPAIADMLAAWKQMVESGYWDKINEVSELAALPAPKTDPNSITRKVWQMMGARLADGKDAVCCQCVNKDGLGVIAALSRNAEKFECQHNKCNFTWPVSDFMNAPVHPAWKPVKGGLMDMPPAEAKQVLESLQDLSDAPAAPLSDEEVFAALTNKCEMKLNPKQQDHWVGFGRFMLEFEPVEEWSRALAKTFYETYKETANANA